jgi:hypothetical protein
MAPAVAVPMIVVVFLVVTGFVGYVLDRSA